MKLKPTSWAAMLAATILFLIATPAGAEVGPSTVESQLAAELAAHPDGQISDNRIEYPDGSGFVAIEVGVASTSDCDSGWFCMWTSANYTGSFSYKSGTGTKTLSASVRSFWNHRSTVARLYNNAGTSWTCYENGVKKGTVATAYQNTMKVNLLSSANC